VVSAKLLKADELDEIDGEVLDAINAAVDAARSAERPTAEDVLADVYVAY
jgi:pyruvate dehydrogenase E1 component alpha subunit